MARTSRIGRSCLRRSLNLSITIGSQAPSRPGAPILFACGWRALDSANFQRDALWRLRGGRRKTNHAEDFRYSVARDCHVGWIGRGEGGQDSCDVSNGGTGDSNMCLRSGKSYVQEGTMVSRFRERVRELTTWRAGQSLSPLVW